MKAALQEYCREVDERAERFATETEMRERADHIHAFNLGRLSQRVEGVKFESLLRVGWLVAGMLIGMTLGWQFQPLMNAASFWNLFTGSASAVQTTANQSPHPGPR
jgi:hypothetical protein